jgi:protein involved in sex pheromone biosynthesis
MSKKVLAVLFVCMMLLLSACGGAVQAQENDKQS